jgi:hypothetical protein
LVDGFSFRDALDKFVVGDPEVGALRKSAIEIQCWPVLYEKLSLKRDATGQSDDLSRLLRTPKARKAALVVLNRYSALIDLLRDGALVAVGRLATDGPPTVFEESTWKNEDLIFDFELNRLMSRNENAKNVGGFQIELLNSKSEFENEAAQLNDEDLPERNPGGRRSNVIWENIIGSLVHRAGVEGRIPDTQTECRKWVRDYLISERGNVPENSTIDRQLRRRLGDFYLKLGRQ